MLTYDALRQTPTNPLDELKQSSIPDQLECGETNAYWIYVRRSTKKLELVNKENGQTISCSIDKASAQKYGLSERHLIVARRGLTL